MAKTKTKIDQEENTGKKYCLVPPDGGWGWVVVAASGLSNFITIPVMQSFALIFSKRIVQLDMSYSDLSTIINVNAAFGMGLGIVAGPLLSNFGSRKVALFGAVSSFIGITCTSWATSFLDFLLTYSILNSMGTFLLMSSFSLAVNTYFRNRRGYASGMSTTLTGLGPVCMPHLITFLLRTYDTQGTALILGALAAHAILAALLIQPVHWHMKKIPVTNSGEEGKHLLNDSNDETAIELDEHLTQKRNSQNIAEPEPDFDNLSLYGMETPVVVRRQFGSTQQIRKKRKSSAVSFHRSLSQNDDAVDIDLPKLLSRITNENKSQGNLSTESVAKIMDDKKYHAISRETKHVETEKQVKFTKNESKVTINELLNNNHCYDASCETDEEEHEEKTPSPNIIKKLATACVVDVFGLDLLKDSQYVLLVIGMSVAICAELNFSLFTPLILKEYGFALEQIATIMSTVGFNDLIFRFLAPFIGERLGYTNQTMYLLSLIMLITARSSLILFHDYTSAIIVACGLGVAKGFRTVYMGLVIPSYLPLDRLPHGSGIQSAVNCLCIVMSIPLMAEVRSRTGSYNFCILALNCITASTVILWTLQILHNKSKQRKENESRKKFEDETRNLEKKSLKDGDGEKSMNDNDMKKSNAK